MAVDFQIQALRAADFSPFFALSNAESADYDARRVVADADFGYPCRVNFTDARAGEELVLVQYRTKGPVYVRVGAVTAPPEVNEIPETLRRCELSVRGYDIDWMLKSAKTVTGTDLEAAFADLFDDPRVAQAHVHNAAPGCFNRRVVR